MYLNGCMGYPPLIPFEMVTDYWTSYSAYHEAAFAALMTGKRVSSMCQESPQTSLPSGLADDKETMNPKHNGHDSDTKSSINCIFESSGRKDSLLEANHLCGIDKFCPHTESKLTGGRASPNELLDFSKKNSRPQVSSLELKFGISRILSDKVGVKEKDSVKHDDRPEHEDQFIPTTCPCSSTSCPFVVCRRVPSLPSSLSAVHALRPPQYPVTTGADSLPGPYSVLNADSNCPSHPKRKRSWSRAVFSQLQRKGLEKRFEVQKYVTKPDRRQLAAMLGLTDAQVKVWFQNRRMKWRHAEKSAQQTTASKDVKPADLDKDSECTESETKEDDQCPQTPDISAEEDIDQMDNEVDSDTNLTPKVEQVNSI